MALVASRSAHRDMCCNGERPRPMSLNARVFAALCATEYVGFAFIHVGYVPGFLVFGVLQFRVLSGDMGMARQTWAKTGVTGQRGCTSCRGLSVCCVFSRSPDSVRRMDLYRHRSCSYPDPGREVDWRLTANSCKSCLPNPILLKHECIAMQSAVRGLGPASAVLERICICCIAAGLSVPSGPPRLLGSGHSYLRNIATSQYCRHMQPARDNWTNGVQAERMRCFWLAA